MLQWLLLVELTASLTIFELSEWYHVGRNLQLESGQCILGEFEADYVEEKGKQVYVTCTKYIQPVSEQPQLD